MSLTAEIFNLQYSLNQTLRDNEKLIKILWIMEQELKQYKALADDPAIPKKLRQKYIRKIKFEVPRAGSGDNKPSEGVSAGSEEPNRPVGVV